MEKLVQGFLPHDTQPPHHPQNVYQQVQIPSNLSTKQGSHKYQVSELTERGLGSGQQVKGVAARCHALSSPPPPCFAETRGIPIAGLALKWR